MTKARDLATSGPDLGLVHISTTNFSTTSSQAFTVFNSTYDNYRIIVNIASTSTDMDLRLGLGNSGSEDTGANFNWSYWIRNNSGTNLSFDGINTTYAFLASMETYVNDFYTNVVIDIYNPFKTEPTGGTVNLSTVNISGSVTMGAGGFLRGTNTSYADLFLKTSTGNMTGSVSVYGYKE